MKYKGKGKYMEGNPPGQQPATQRWKEDLGAILMLGNTDNGTPATFDYIQKFLQIVVWKSKRISGHMIALTKQCRTVELLFEVVIYWNLSRQHFKRRAAQKSSYQRKAIFHISWERDQLLRQKGVEEYETTIFGINY